MSPLSLKKILKKKRKYNLNARIKSALRKLWLWGPMRAEALKRAKVSPGVSLCNGCKRLTKKPEIDHIVPVAGEGEWDGYINRLFCSPDLLQCLCHECHLKVTEERKNEC